MCWKCAHYDPWCSHFEHQGMYTELQVGPAASQLHTVSDRWVVTCLCP